VVGSAKTNTPAEVSALASDTSAVNTARSTVSGLALTISQATLAVQSAQDQVNLTTAGSPVQDIDAQRAQVAGIAASLRQAEIIAPFSGTVGSVSVKAGDVVSANAPAIALLPEGNFQVEVYVSEIEMTKLSVGDIADVTLDAYGSSRVFPAAVSSIDRAPSQAPSGSQGYKVTLVFNNADPAITVGMHANALMHGGSKSGVLIIPRAALVTDGTTTYVLKKSGNGSVKTSVTLGLISDTSVEIVSGLSAGDQVAVVGSH
jgi:RND family efflux transporter MFP subunit